MAWSASEFRGLPYKGRKAKALSNGLDFALCGPHMRASHACPHGVCPMAVFGVYSISFSFHTLVHDEPLLPTRPRAPGTIGPMKAIKARVIWSLYYEAHLHMHCGRYCAFGRGDKRSRARHKASAQAEARASARLVSDARLFTLNNDTTTAHESLRRRRAYCTEWEPCLGPRQRRCSDDGWQEHTIQRCAPGAGTTSAQFSHAFARPLENLSQRWLAERPRARPAERRQPEWPIFFER